MDNALSRLVSGVERLPAALRGRALSVAIGRVVPFAGTGGVRILEMVPGRVRATIPNRRKVQNHIGGLHACAMALLVESVTGYVVGLEVPGDRVPVISEMRITYKKRAKGALTATATLSDEERERIRTTEKGKVVVPVTVVDEAGVEPIECEFTWAWTPKRRS